MAAQLIREWTAIQQFPAATQEKLADLLAKLKNQVKKEIVFLIKFRQPWFFVGRALLAIWKEELICGTILVSKWKNKFFDD